MSESSVHHALVDLYAQKSSQEVLDLLSHADFAHFMGEHKLTMPVATFSHALIHTSFSNEFQVPHQEKLEFLGDAVLQLILTAELFKRFPQEKEGSLSRLRSSLVNEKSLAHIARGLGLNKLILVGKGEYKKDLHEQDVVLADSFEAITGLIYLSQGIEFTSALLLSWYERFIPGAYNLENLETFDAKSLLQQKVLAQYKKLPRYSAEPHGDGFEVKLWINEEVVASGTFSSKKSGEKELAQTVLKNGTI